MRSFFLVLLFLMAGLYWGVGSFFAPLTHGLHEETYRDQGGQVSLESVIGTAADSGTRPNVIIILADDLGYGDVGVYGAAVIETPHMDRLASQGMRFSQAYSSAPICSPSRAGLLTGRYPLRSGITQAMQAAGDSLQRKLSYKAGIAFSNLASIDMRGGGNLVKGLPLSELTLAEVLQAAGYHSSAFGKWHLGDFTQWPQFHPFRHGFESLCWF